MQTDVEFMSLDGTVLCGTLVEPDKGAHQALVLVLGGGVTREEGGFFGRIADGLAARGVASLRFDLRGHGASAGPQELLTLAGVVNDIRAAVEHVVEVLGGVAVGVLGASFGGGLAATFAARYPKRVGCLVLINPLLDYKRRLIDEKPYWSNEHIEADTARTLTEQGFVEHSPSFRLGRPLLNELFYLRPKEEIAQVRAPTLILHGTADTFIPVESSREHVDRVQAKAKLIEIEGAQHGIAVDGDPEYRDVQTQAWQAQAVVDITDWVVTHV
jgi:alpha-beta hydrolase superfamily lysophospholipase